MGETVSLAESQGAASRLRAQRVHRPLACSRNKKQPRWMEHSQREEANGRRKGCKDRGNAYRVGPCGNLCRVLRGTSVQCFGFYTE